MQGLAGSRGLVRGAGALALALLLVAGCKRENKAKRRVEASAANSAALPAASPSAAQDASAESTGKPRCPKPDAGRSSIDDFEDADSGTGLFPGEGGSWFIATDKTKGGRVSPAEGPANPARLEQQRCGSVFAMHFSGDGLREWGAVLAATFRYDQKSMPVDLSAYAGVVFWLRAGPSHAGLLRFDVDDGFTHRDGGQCSEAADAERRCWNSFGFEMPVLGDDWEEHRIRFDSLTQKFPESEPRPLDLKNVHRVSFKASPGNSFDVWIDDVALFR